MYVFIIATSHHLIQVHQALKQFKIEEGDAILIHVSLGCNKLNSSLISSLDYHVFPNWTFRDLLRHPRLYRPYIKYLKGLRKKKEFIILFSSQYSTDYTLLAKSILNPDRFFLMDEGTASFNVSINRKMNKGNRCKLLLKSALYGHIISHPDKLCYFSQYSIPLTGQDELVTYSFEKEKNTLVINDTSAIVLGTTLVEIGLVPEILYFHDLKKISSFLSRKGIEKIDYYAHRKESEEKLKRVGILGWNVKHNEEPFEFCFPKLNPCPNIVVCFLSPILDTISKKYENIPQFYIVAPLHQIADLDKRELYTCILEEFMNNKRLEYLEICSE